MQLSGIGPTTASAIVATVGKGHDFTCGRQSGRAPATSRGSQATIVLVVADPEAERYLTIDRYDLGQATMAMMVAAADLGIGSGHSSVGDQDAARRILGVPAGHTAAYMIALGYPADRPLAPGRRPDRRPFDVVVHRGTW